MWRTFRDYGEMTDSPVDRWRDYLFKTVTSESLSNVLLGGVGTAVAGVLAGSASIVLLEVMTVLWVVALALYGVGNELQAAREAAAREFEDTPRGIE